MVEISRARFGSGEWVCAVDRVNEERPAIRQILPAQVEKNQYFRLGKMVDLLFGEYHIERLLISLKESERALYMAIQIFLFGIFNFIRKRINPQYITVPFLESVLTKYPGPQLITRILEDLSDGIFGR
jgi:hypothetical protein